MKKIYNKTLDEEIKSIKDNDKDNKGILSGYKKLKIPLLSPQGRSSWPKRFPIKRISELKTRVGEKKFLAQMQLQPIDLTEPYFNISDFQTYTDSYIKTEQNFTPIYKVNNNRVHKASAYWDPSAGGKKQDGSVLTIGFKDQNDNIYVEKIEYLNKYIKLQSKNSLENNSITTQIEVVISFLKEYDVGILHIETNGIGKFIPELITKEIRKQRLKIEISEVYNHTAKSIRIIEGIEPLLSAKIIYFNIKNFEKSSALKNEIKSWRPKIDGKDDGLDSLSGLTLNRFKNIISSPIKTQYL